MAAAAGISASERAKKCKDKGNEAFRRRDYSAAVEHYSAALEAFNTANGSVGSSEEAAAADLRLPLLTNRSLVRFRLGHYAAAAEDAESALSVDPCSSKAAFRAAAARLALGEAAAALRHAELLQPTAPSAPATSGATSPPAVAPPAGWVTLRQHASALLRHQQRVQACCLRREERRAKGHAAGKGQVEGQVHRLLGLLAAEAEGEADEDSSAGPADLLGQLTDLLNTTADCKAGSRGSSGGSGASPAASTADAAADAAAAFCAAPGLRGWRLLLFFLADADPCCQAAAHAALKAAGTAAAGGVAAVLWPQEVWQRLVGAATEHSSSSSCGSNSIAIAAMQLLCWAAGRDAWVRQQLLPHPLPAPEGAPVGPPAAAAAAAMAGDGSSAVGGSPLAQIVSCFGDSTRLRHMPPGGVIAAAHLLQLYGRDAESAGALEHLACAPLLALVRAFTAAEGMAAFQPAGGQETSGHAANDGGGGAGSSGGAAQAERAASASSSGGLADSEQEALAELRVKRQAVYNEGLVLTRRALLEAAAELARGSRELVLAEAVAHKSGGGGKRVAGAGALLKELLSLVRSLHDHQPRRSTPVLGPDGAPRTYEKRRFAADFKDNPAGDFLLTLDLDSDSRAQLQASAQAASGTQQHLQTQGQQLGAGQGQGQGQHAQSSTLLELSLDLLQTAGSSSTTVAALLYRLDLLTLCQELGAYCTPSVVAAGQKLVATLADAVPAAAEELLQSGGSSGSSDGGDGGGGSCVSALVGLLLWSDSWQRQVGALGKLAALVDTCSGDDFGFLTGLNASQAGAGGAALASAAARASAVYRAWELAGVPAAAQQGAEGEAAVAGGRKEIQAAARRFLLRCCERAQRQQQVGPAAAPRGGACTAIGRQPLLQLLKQERQQGAAGAAKGTPPSQQDASSFSTLKRGFFSAPVKQQAAGEAAAQHAPAASPKKVQEAAGCSVTRPSSLRPKTETKPGSSTSSNASTSSTINSTTYKSGAVVIEEFADDEEAPTSSSVGALSAPAQQPGAPQQGVHRAAVPLREGRRAGKEETTREAAERDEEGASEEEEEEEVADLRDVFDSSTRLPAQLRRERVAWVALPLDRKLKWNQTSSDVSVLLAVPAGTAAADVAVSAAGGRLAISLRWFGCVVEGTLHQPVKAAETHWCLEGGELHVLLTKGDSSWWKSLLEGGEEKSYYEILQEAVNADEPVQPYDQMDESARGLVEAIQERQAHIGAGLIDPEGFDDFRVVIGENSLGGGPGRHRG